jgi:hypothetical protein
LQVVTQQAKAGELTSAFVAFRAAPATETCVAFRDNAHALTGQIPYIQRHHFGAAIALGWPGDTWFIA